MRCYIFFLQYLQLFYTKVRFKPPIYSSTMANDCSFQPIGTVRSDTVQLYPGGSSNFLNGEAEAVIISNGGTHIGHIIIIAIYPYIPD